MVDAITTKTQTQINLKRPGKVRPFDEHIPHLNAGEKIKIRNHSRNEDLRTEHGCDPVPIRFTKISFEVVPLHPAHISSDLFQL